VFWYLEALGDAWGFGFLRLNADLQQHRGKKREQREGHEFTRADTMWKMVRALAPEVPILGRPRQVSQSFPPQIPQMNADCWLW
jgi:hypothetical protein